MVRLPKAWNQVQTRMPNLWTAMQFDKAPTLPGSLAVAVTYTGLRGDRKDSLTEKLISIKRISFVIAAGIRRAGTERRHRS